MSQPRPEPTISAEPFGAFDGQPVERYTLTSGPVRARILTYGGIVQTIEVPDRGGRSVNVALGYPTLDDYFGGDTFFGAIIGRFANRIAKGRFTLDGAAYDLPTNDGPNTLHGGPSGLDQRVWEVRFAQPIDGGVALGLRVTSPDGDQSFPGALSVDVTYTLAGEGDLRIEYRAVTDRPTVVNFTNHSYFNLTGEGTGDVGDHVLTVHADHYTPIDATLIPTGGIEPVAGTPFDFRSPTRIGEHLRDGFAQLVLAQGYDHNFVLNRPTPDDRALILAATAVDPASGRALEVLTTEPGLQFYSGNFLTGARVGTSGRIYRQGDGFTLETQHYPDSPNRTEFPSTVLRPGEVFLSTTMFRFSVRH